MAVPDVQAASGRGLSFESERKFRRPNLTPMIDVVFLLLVFFMLASRFGLDQSLPLAVAGGDGGYSGPPRLVTVLPGAVALNGVAIAEADLAAALWRLAESPDDIVVLRPGPTTKLQRVVTLLDGLAAAGFRRVVLLEQADGT